MNKSQIYFYASLASVVLSIGIWSANPIIRTLDLAPIHSASRIARESEPKIRNMTISPMLLMSKISQHVL